MNTQEILAKINKPNDKLCRQQRMLDFLMNSETPKSIAEIAHLANVSTNAVYAFIKTLKAAGVKLPDRKTGGFSSMSQMTVMLQQIIALLNEIKDKK